MHESTLCVLQNISLLYKVIFIATPAYGVQWNMHTQSWNPSWETCLLPERPVFLCVCVCACGTREAGGCRGQPLDSLNVQGESGVSVCLWVSVREELRTSRWRRTVAFRHLHVQVPAAEVTRNLSASYWIDWASKEGSVLHLSVYMHIHGALKDMV